MNQKGFINIVLVVIAALIAAGAYFVSRQILSPASNPTPGSAPAPLPVPAPTPLPAPTPRPAPVPAIECKKDSDCPSSKYICETIQGRGRASPDGGPSVFTIEKGLCKLREGNRCRRDSDCVSGLLCHTNVCASPIGRQCSGPDDTSCPVGLECVQGCGSPVSYPGEPPAPYFCQLKGYRRICPICLAGNILIATPSGLVPIKDLEVGRSIWTVDKAGRRLSGVIIQTSKVPVPPTHQMVHLILSDGRELLASPGHPTADSRTVGEIAVGELYDGASVASTERVSYGEGATYDILPSGDTGFYWANGILIGSTLR